MKQIQNSLMLLVVLVGIGLGCRKVVEVPIAGPTIEGKPSVASLAAQSLSRSGNTTQFSVDLFVVNRNGRYVTGLQAGAFTIPGNSSLTYRLDNLTSSRQAGGGAASYSALLLMDQSGSIYSTDPQNLRLQAGKIFLDYLGSNDRAALASFTSWNGSSDGTVIHHGFSRNANAMKITLDSLAGRAGGGTPLYRSLFSMTNYTATQVPETSRRAVVAFTDGQDTDFGVSVQQLIQNSASKKVPLFTVGLSSSVNANVLAQIANETGGAFFYAKDAEQLVTAFGTLGNLLRGSATLYRTTWTATRSSGTWSIGQALSGTINVNLPSGETVEAPFWVQIK